MVKKDPVLLVIAVAAMIAGTVGPTLKTVLSELQYLSLSEREVSQEIGVIDPLEGSLVILLGTATLALGARLGNSRHRMLL